MKMKRQFTHSDFKKSVAVLALLLVPTFFQNCAKTNFQTVPAVDSDASSKGNGDNQGEIDGVTTIDSTSIIDTSGTMSTGGTLGTNGTISGGINPISTGGTMAAIGSVAVCSAVLQNIDQPVKLLFIVDTSGSNASAPGTDPKKTFRGGSIQKFFSDYSTKANFSWGMISFSNDKATSLVAGNLSNNASDMQAAINKFFTITDNGDTPYAVALTSGINVLTADAKTKTASTKYIVVFLSDGLPNPALSDTQLTTAVQNVMNVAPGQVSFSTVYYGPKDPTAAGRLQLMATTGKGNFIDTNANPGADFEISNVIAVPGVVCK